jgi:hypothetical protein
MPPKKKARKLTDKDFREALLARLERTGTTEPLVGSECPKDSLKGFNSFDTSVSVRVDMSYRTEEIRGALVTFYNGRGNIVGAYVPNSGESIAEFRINLAKVVCFGLDTAMKLPADDVPTSLTALGIPDLEYLAGNEINKLEKKASMKWVTVATGATKPSLFETITFSAFTKSVAITPLSAVTNDSNNLCPENDKVVLVNNYNSTDTDQQETLGKAILQRSILALSREEAKFHPDGKYHGERMKWADV